MTTTMTTTTMTPTKATPNHHEKAIEAESGEHEYKILMFTVKDKSTSTVPYVVAF